jgi:NAD(P)-dependent dehydrogenase (short-subunit alcohol dehydrogenase family)
MSKLAGKIALITGGNSGMGLATAQEFISEGAKVVITGRRKEAVEQAVQQLGPDGTGIVGDVSILSDLDSLYSQIRDKFGKLDILFANAGIVEMRPISDVDEAAYDRIADINIKGLFFTVQKSLPLLNDGASIILNSSALHQKGMANASVYIASKAAVRSFSRTFAAELKDRKIRVNTISPGPIATPIMSKMGLPAEEEQQMAEGFAQMVPLGRLGSSEDIAHAALYLASDDSKFVTGIDLSVDGGFAQL